MVAVLTWARTSTHDRAEFLRGKVGLKTLLWPSNFEEYLGFSDLPEQTGVEKQGRAPPATGKAAIGIDLFARVAAMMNDEDDQRRNRVEVIDA